MEHVDHAFAHDAFDVVEVDDHTLGRTVVTQWSADGDVQAIRMSVHARALAEVVRQNVRRFETETAPDLQGWRGYSVPSGPIASSRRLSSARKPLAT